MNNEQRKQPEGQPPRSAGWTIKKRLSVLSVVVVAALLVNGLVTLWLVERINRDVRQLAEVEETLEEVVLEMEINAGETARAVLDYIRTLDPDNESHAHDSEKDFEGYADEFARLAETDAEREIGQQVHRLYQDYKRLADEIMERAATRQVKLVHHKARQL